MPKAKNSSTDVKAEPYEKESPQKGRASPTKGAKGVSWTKDMDDQVLQHVLARSDINLRFDWADLQKNNFPHLTVTQIRSRWDYKLKDALFPPEVLKMKKKAKASGEGNAKAGPAE